MKPPTCKGQGYPHKNPKRHELRMKLENGIPTYIIPIILTTGVKGLTSLPNTSLLVHMMHLVLNKIFKCSPASEHHRMVWAGKASQVPALLRLKESPKNNNQEAPWNFTKMLFSVSAIWQHTAEWESGKWGKARAELVLGMKIVITKSHHKWLESCKYSRLGFFPFKMIQTQLPFPADGESNSELEDAHKHMAGVDTKVWQ